jgi:hypothetical protein
VRHPFQYLKRPRQNIVGRLAPDIRDKTDPARIALVFPAVQTAHLKLLYKITSFEAFPKRQFCESNFKFRSFARLKAGRPKASKTARACPKTVRASAKSISFGTGPFYKIFPSDISPARQPTGNEELETGESITVKAH